MEFRKQSTTIGFTTQYYTVKKIIIFDTNYQIMEFRKQSTMIGLTTQYYKVKVIIIFEFDTNYQRSILSFLKMRIMRNQLHFYNKNNIFTICK